MGLDRSGYFLILGALFKGSWKTLSRAQLFFNLEQVLPLAKSRYGGPKPSAIWERRNYAAFNALTGLASRLRCPPNILYGIGRDEPRSDPEVDAKRGRPGKRSTHIRRLCACSFASGARDTAESVTSWSAR